jgi:hypothetical protein
MFAFVSFAELHCRGNSVAMTKVVQAYAAALQITQELLGSKDDVATILSSMLQTAIRLHRESRYVECVEVARCFLSSSMQQQLISKDFTKGLKLIVDAAIRSASPVLCAKALNEMMLAAFANAEIEAHQVLVNIIEQYVYLLSKTNEDFALNLEVSAMAYDHQLLILTTILSQVKSYRPNGNIARAYVLVLQKLQCLVPESSGSNNKLFMAKLQLEKSQYVLSVNQLQEKPDLLVDRLQNLSISSNTSESAESLCDMALKLLESDIKLQKIPSLEHEIVHASCLIWRVICDHFSKTFDASKVIRVCSVIQAMKGFVEAFSCICCFYPPIQS